VEVAKKGGDRKNEAELYTVINDLRDKWAIR